MASDTMDVDGDMALARGVRRAAINPVLMAGLIEAWRLAAPGREPRQALDCPERLVTHLALCLRPRPGRWTEDVAEIAADLGLDPDRLAPFVEAGEAAERIAGGGAKP